MTVKSLLNQAFLKKKKQELGIATETTKLTLKREPNYESPYTNNLVPKFKRYLLDKTLARSLPD